MKNLTIVVIVIFVLAFCKAARAQDPQAELKDYVTRALKYWGEPLPKTKVTYEFGPVDNGLAGVCDFAVNKITFDRAYWATSSNERRMYLVLHEVGHCFFDYDHSNDPRDIMYYRIPATEDKVLSTIMRTLFLEKKTTAPKMGMVK